MHAHTHTLTHTRRRHPCVHCVHVAEFHELLLNRKLSLIYFIRTTAYLFQCISAFSKCHSDYNVCSCRGRYTTRTHIYWDEQTRTLMAVMDSTANIQNALAPLMSFIGVHLFTYILVNFIMCSCSEWNMFPVPHTHRTRKYVLCRCPVQQPQPLPQQSKIQIESSNKTLLTLLTAAACEFHLNANECEQFFLIVLSETMRLFGWIGGQFEHLSIRCADAACDYDISNVSFSIFFSSSVIHCAYFVWLHVF